MFIFTQPQELLYHWQGIFAKKVFPLALAIYFRYSVFILMLIMLILGLISFSHRGGQQP